MVSEILSGIAKDEGASDTLVVENNNDPRDALAQQADLVDLTNFNVFILPCHEPHDKA